MQSVQFNGTISICVQCKDKKEQQSTQIYFLFFFNIFFNSYKYIFFLIYHIIDLIVLVKG
jgi:hypothetical protein